MQANATAPVILPAAVALDGGYGAELGNLGNTADSARRRSNRVGSSMTALKPRPRT